MIDSLQISRFKRFDQAALAISPLTVLTGVNGGGKSTILQTFILSRIASTSPGRAIHLNGLPYDTAAVVRCVQATVSA
jgi:recombinational DNA repair ATPase RecF